MKRLLVFTFAIAFYAIGLYFYLEALKGENGFFWVPATIFFLPGMGVFEAVKLIGPLSREIELLATHGVAFVLHYFYFSFWIFVIRMKFLRFL